MVIANCKEEWLMLRPCAPGRCALVGATLLVLLSLLLGGPATAAGYRFETSWGSGGSGDGQFDCPRGIVVAGAGRVYVADTKDLRRN